MIQIRDENPDDVGQIRIINLTAFGQRQEADLVDRLRNACDPFISLVAEKDNRVVGQILFTPVQIQTDHGTIQGLGLAPLAVLPENQKQGIGSSLVIEGIRRVKHMHYPFIVVLGHPGYYIRFGFEPAAQYGIRSEWKVPDEAFMISIFDPSKLKDISGIAAYRPEFAETI